MGYQRQEVIGKTAQDLGLFANYEDRTRLCELFKSLGRIVNFSIDVRDRAGNIHAGLFSVEMIRSQNEPCWLTSLIDITREKRLQETLEAANLALQRKADVDGLTGIYNHAYLMNSLDKEMDRAKRYGTALSIIMIDIDNFKTFNDTHGHLVGDQVLKSVAEYLLDSLRSIDVTGRYGGEEFMLILPNTTRIGALDVAERIRLGIASAGFTAKTLSISVSAGVAEFDGQNKDALIQAADYNMYKAKRKGKNRVEG
jgi:diguanylate cyclase (GGDEF)-like protein